MAESYFPGVQSYPALNTIEPVIPDKLYFKIEEVCELTGIKQHVLRYWESEFSIIRPQRASSKQRLYRREDVKNILRIKKLVHEKGFTVVGVRKALGNDSKEPQPGENHTESQDNVVPSVHVMQDYEKHKTVLEKWLLGNIKSELLYLKDILEKNS